MHNTKAWRSWAEVNQIIKIKKKNLKEKSSFSQLVDLYSLFFFFLFFLNVYQTLPGLSFTKRAERMGFYLHLNQKIIKKAAVRGAKGNVIK